MKALVGYLRRTMSDSLFQRVCVALFAGPMAAGLGYRFITFSEPNGAQWLIWALMLVLFLFFFVVLWIAIFGTEPRFKRVLTYLGGGDHPLALLFVLMVIVLALPITHLIKLVKKPHAL